MSNNKEASTFSAFKVNKNRALQGNIQYLSIFYEDRVIFAKVGGQFSGGGVAGITGMVLGGVVGSLIGDEVDKRLQKRSEAKKGDVLGEIFEKDHEEILSMDKNNFEIRYYNITKVSMKKSGSIFGSGTGTITFEGKRKEKFEIASNQIYEVCEEIVKTHLDDKFV